MKQSEYILLMPDPLKLSINISEEHNGSTLTPGAGSNGTFVSDDKQHFVHYILYVIGVLVTSATVIGNVLVIVAVISDKRLRKVGNVFIINLAVSDCLVGIFVSPLAITYDITSDWLLGNVMCDIWVSLDIISCTASILNLCAIAYDRYRAITEPMTYARQRTFSRAWCVVAFVWIYSFLIALPRFLGWRDEDEEAQDGNCFISREIGYTLYSTFGAFFLPLLFMIFFYYRIFCATCTRKKSWSLHRGHLNFITNNDENVDKSNVLSCYLCRLLPCFSKGQALPPTTTEQATQTSNNELCNVINITETESEVDNRRESIEPEILAIFQMRHRSERIFSNATVSSFGSTFYSSTDSSNTATTSFSEGSDRSSSISAECRDRSSSTCTTGSRSFSSGPDTARRLSAFRAHRLSNPRHSALQAEVIHEIEKTMIESSYPENVELKATGTALETDDTHDELSEEDKTGDQPKHKRRKSLKSATFRRRNSRKSRKMAMNQEKRAAKTLGVVIGCFIICWLPFFIVTLLRSLCLNCHFYPLLVQSLSWLGYFNSACNPFIYTFFNKDFRNAFKKISCYRSSNVVYL
ncbi:5-hydroxytryptamine receptor 1A-like [Ruditapes philippinarum]|uniref:5-hydroxytryptamine receptor 1A-like n=1 Tax=Ruditapes philippinarum TaxID=129788 RepID=UPI00295BBC18|nr:5-hydroxytryptamine receptor 1A-like [Ruditapes philippinarum]